MHTIELGVKDGISDPEADRVLAAAREAGIPVTAASHVRAYTVDKDLPLETLRAVAERVFRDRVVERASVDAPLFNSSGDGFVVEVGLKPGFIDNEGNTARYAIEQATGSRFGSAEGVYASHRYFLSGHGLTAAHVEALVRDHLANEMTSRWHAAPSGSAERLEPPRVRLDHTPRVERLSLDLDDDGLLALSKRRALALNLSEMRAIQGYYRSEGRDPTDAELELLGQTWSEHCKHKIATALVDYYDRPIDPANPSEPERIDNLLKTFLREPTRRAQRADILSAFSDNAGIFRLTKDWGFAIKNETHNSPTNADPYGGAGTGIGGVIRDILGVGMGGLPVCNIVAFCTGYPDYKGPLKPQLHPNRILRGAVHGAGSYGNAVGVPTIFGYARFHDGWIGKPIVYAGTAGLVPTSVAGVPGHTNSVESGDRIIMVGGRVGIDGIHGATVSSMEASATTAAEKRVFTDHVQIGSPYTERKLIEFLMEARDRGLYRATTDNGAGGLGSSVGEMAQKIGGADLALDNVPLKYDGLDGWQILESEAQERMTLAVPPERLEEARSLAALHGIELADLGSFESSGRLRVSYRGEQLADLRMGFLHEGVPRMHLRAVWQPPESRITETDAPAPTAYAPVFDQLLSSWNLASNEWILRRFDHEVQGMSVVKPYTGAARDVDSDAAVLKPLSDSPEGVAMTAVIHPEYGEIDTYAMAAVTLDEAVRRALATGSDLSRIYLQDNFCWPSPLPGPKNPDAEYKMAQFVRSWKALRDGTEALGTCFVSGKDSMSLDGNVPHENGTVVRVSAPPTLQVSATGILADASRAVTLDAKRAGDLVYVLGITRDELGGSAYAKLCGISTRAVPQARFAESRPLYAAVSAITAAGLAASLHAVERGGLGIALAKTAFAGGLGMNIALSRVPALDVARDDHLLFSESAGRFVATVSPERARAFEAALAGTPYAPVGSVTAAPALTIYDRSGSIETIPLALLKERWQAPFGGRYA